MNRFLLYIDLLGFSDLVLNKPEVLPKIFYVLDRSNAHRHGSFKVIQFSDTLLIYNEYEARTLDDKRYGTMYLCEFAQELQYMLLGRDAYFRALITFGRFEDTGPTPNLEYKNVRAFWGEALIKAYRNEKDIQAIGLFVDDTVKPFMDIFEMHEYDKEKGLWFVDTTKMFRDKGLDKRDFEYLRYDAVVTGNESLLSYDLVYLERLCAHAHDVSLAPRIRVKYQTTWEIYRRKYGGLCAALEEANFDFRKVIKIDWEPFLKKIGTDEGFYG